MKGRGRDTRPIYRLFSPWLHLAVQTIHSVTVALRAGSSGEALCSLLCSSLILVMLVRHQRSIYVRCSQFATISAQSIHLVLSAYYVVVELTCVKQKKKIQYCTLETPMSNQVKITRIHLMIITYYHVQLLLV